MLVLNAKTWTIVLILYVLPKCAFSAVARSRELAPKTLFQALVEKFPQIQLTTLRNTLNEIFSSKCNNWTTIQQANPTFKDKGYVPCRLLYESIDSFLTSVGNQIVLTKSFVDTVMSSNHTLQDICLGNKSFSSHFSVLSSKTNVSAYLTPTICLLSCMDLSKSLTNQSIDTCKAAYFFATFDVLKFITDSKSLLKKSDQTNQENKESLLKESESQAPAPKGEPKIQNNQLPMPAKAEVQKSKQTYDNEKTLDHPQGEQQPLANEKIVQGQNVASVTKVQGNGLNSDEGKIENGHDKTEPSVDDGVVASGTKPETKLLNKTETLQEEKSPNSLTKDLSNVDKTSVELNNNNDRENQEDNSLDNDNGEAYSGVIGDDLENAKQDENIKLGLSQQTESKKLKPNTLDADEPASSDNIIDDDMDGDSYFFSYFTVLMCLVIVGYVGYHNRQKVLALLLEGKRGKRNGRNARRPNSANYHKLDSNLEEAMSSSCTKNASNVIY
ncbi:putative mediator of RNA polymerase II transcription subunit 26 [Euwallacea similis]|uniref:putative mediator of RNA polymerase II transcription subunit 26 n=1 Tax=Euwallacea similis TaxID=1736056 RepID=UPI003450BCA5